MNSQEAQAQLEWPMSTWKTPDTISTGSLGLDLALGGGWPRGRITELFGPEGSGKTTLARASALWQTTAWIDPRNEIAAGDFVINRSMVIIPASTDSAALYVARTSCGSADLVVLDSIDALDIEHPYTTWSNRMVSQLGQDAANTNTAVLLLQGLLTDDGALVNDYALNKVIRGQAHVRVRLDASKHEDYSDVAWRVIKWNGQPPYYAGPTGTFRVKDGKIDRVRELVELAVARHVITRKRSWYYFGRVKLGNGLSTTVAKVEEACLAEIEAAVRERH